MAVKTRNRFLQAILITGLLLSPPLFAFASTIYGSDLYGSGTYAGSAPVVTTDSSSAIGQTGVTLGGTITSIGSTSPSVRGFVYGASNTYGATTTDSAGPFLTGSFSATISSLTCNTGYHFAAYATSTNGIGYGSDLTFTTSACPSGAAAPSGGGLVVGSGPLAPGYQVGSTSVASTVASTSVNGLPGSSTSSPLITGSVSLSFNRNLQLGATGDDVRALQQYLNTHGFPVASSGAGSFGQETDYFGPATKAALAKYQAAKGIAPAVGYFGPETRAAISGGTQAATTTSADTSVFTRDLQLGDTGSDVQVLQQYLNAHGFLLANSGPGSPGHETDVFGFATQYQLSQLQKADGTTPATGYFGSKTRAFLSNE